MLGVRFKTAATKKNSFVKLLTEINDYRVSLCQQTYFRWLFHEGFLSYSPLTYKPSRHSMIYLYHFSINRKCLKVIYRRITVYYLSEIIPQSHPWDESVKTRRSFKRHKLAEGLEETTKLIGTYFFLTYLQLSA